MLKYLVAVVFITEIIQINGEEKNVFHKFPSQSFSLNLERFESTSNTDKDVFNAGSLRLFRKGRNEFGIAGDFSLMINLGDESTANLEIHSENALGEYKKIYHKSLSVCDMMELKDGKIYDEVAAASNFPQPKVCPFPKGDYTIKDFMIGKDALPDTLPPGKYLVRITCTTGDQYRYGFNIFGTVE